MGGRSYEPRRRARSTWAKDPSVGCAIRPTAMGAPADRVRSAAERRLRPRPPAADLGLRGEVAADADGHRPRGESRPGDPHAQRRAAGKPEAPHLPAEADLP